MPQYRTLCTLFAALSILAVSSGPAWAQDATGEVSLSMSIATKNQASIAFSSGVFVGDFGDAVSGGAFGDDLYHGHRLTSSSVCVGTARTVESGTSVVQPALGVFFDF